MKARGTWKGWLEEMKTCLISTATNDDAVLPALCPVIGLCHSLYLKTHVIPSNTPTSPPFLNTNRPIPGQGSGAGEGWRSRGMARSEDVAQEEWKEQQKLMLVWEAASVLLLIKHFKKKVSTSKHTGAMLSYMKVMHYGLMFPKACYGDAALIWNALCGKWIYRSGEKKPGVGADHNLKLDLIGSSKSPWVWIFRTYVQYVWGIEATAAKATHRNMHTRERCAGLL